MIRCSRDIYIVTVVTYHRIYSIQLTAAVIRRPFPVTTAVKLYQYPIGVAPTPKNRLMRAGCHQRTCRGRDRIGLTGDIDAAFSVAGGGVNHRRVTQCVRHRQGCTVIGSPFPNPVDIKLYQEALKKSMGGPGRLKTTRRSDTVLRT